MTEQAGEVGEADGTGSEVVIAGGGVGGLALALMLGRAGRRVTVVERDEPGDDADPEAAFAGTRRGVAQTHQTHGFLARLRLELRDRLPDVLAAVEAAGAHTLPLSPDLGGPMPGDEDLAVLIVRRTTLEWVLRRAVAAEPCITLRTGETVAGLVAAEAAEGSTAGEDGRPHVVGARLSGGEVLPGTVVACTGSRGDVPAWLAELGVEVAEEEHQTKLIYLTRWYRLPAGRTPDELGGRLFGDLGYLRYLVVPCDGRTLSATLAVHVKDADLRARLLDPERFDKAVRRLPGPDQFFADEGVEPLGPVRPMAGLVNRLRRFVDDGKQPLVTGFHAVGDAHTCTNPLYGRGCALAMVQAGLLADAFAVHDGDALARGVEYEAASGREVEPWFHGSVQMDQLRDRVEARAARRRAARATEPEPAAEPEAAAEDVVVAPDEATEEAVVAGAAVGQALADDDTAAEDEAATAAATFGRIMVEGGTDPVIGRAIVRLFNLLVLPQDLMSDPELLARVAPLLAKPPQPLPEPEGPTLEELLA
jgi:2-polyprenyl-6-methoxyphenol hydroxylase-like FAD-dependent oxidoreductase